jgi:hypothetical protein
MRVNILSDSNWEAKLDHAMRALALHDFFENRSYGQDLSGGIIVVLMCRDPDLKFKQRIRFSKKPQRLYMDIMLSLPEFISATHAQRRQILAARLTDDIPRIIAKYRFKKFDLPGFSNDLNSEVFSQLLGVDAARYDHLCLERATGF